MSAVLKAHNTAIISNGIVLLDKPVGLSSNAALQRVKRLLKVRKAGHTGSLDPLASGMLPICLGAATKLSHCLLEADKTYQFICYLGRATSTGDAEGEITEQQSVPTLSQTLLEQTLLQFHGSSEQIPPMYSALKYQGKRLYKLARQGKTVERPPRRIAISSIELLDWSAEQFSCQVRCSKGTYIRVLAEDIAKALGTCGHVIGLRRLSVQPFQQQSMVSLETLTQSVHEQSWLQHVLSPAAAVADWPKVQLDIARARQLSAGQSVTVSQVHEPGQVAVYVVDRFIGIGEILPDQRVILRRLIPND